MLKYFNKKAFSIIELLIAIFVIVVGTLAIYSVSQKILSYTSVSVNRLKATYLAQEGIELVRNIRDSNYIQRNNWKLNAPGYNDLDWCSASDGHFCEMDFNDSRLYFTYGDKSNPPVAPQYLKDLKGFFYNYNDRNNTTFKRKISIDSVADDEIEVSVEVIWEEKGQPYSITLKNYLYNWREL